MFRTTQVIHVKRKREDAPVDSLYLETSNKRARPNLAPQFYFKRLLAPSTTSTSSSANGTSIAPSLHSGSLAPGTNPANVTSSSSSSSTAQTATQHHHAATAAEQAEELAAARLLAPPSSLLRGSLGNANGDTALGASSGANGQSILLDADGCPLILSGALDEQVRDPYALRQRERVVRENATAAAAAASAGDAEAGARRRRVVVQLRGAAGSGGRALFSIARAGPAGAVDERMDLDEPVKSSGSLGSGHEEEDDFVYDVFVPAAVPGAKARSVHDSVEWATAKPSGLAGTLLVNEEDADWLGDYFYEGNLDDDDEDRVYSDDEDSNAEDYYGADYPDDEDEDYNHSGSEDE